MEKPPLGLKPEYIWISEKIDQRIEEIKKAMHRFMVIKKPIPKKWINEYYRLRDIE